MNTSQIHDFLSLRQLLASMKVNIPQAIVEQGALVQLQPLQEGINAKSNGCGIMLLHKGHFHFLFFLTFTFSLVIGHLLTIHFHSFTVHYHSLLVNIYFLDNHFYFLNYHFYFLSIHFYFPDINFQIFIWNCTQSLWFSKLIYCCDRIHPHRSKTSHNLRF